MRITTPAGEFTGSLTVEHGYLDLVDPEADGATRVGTNGSRVYLARQFAGLRIDGLDKDFESRTAIQGPLLQRPQEFCQGIRRGLGAALERITSWIEEGKGDMLFIGIDGAAGSGKSTLAAQIKGLLQDLYKEVPLVEFPLDKFLGTERNSPLRAIKNSQPELFWSLFSVRDAIEKGLIGLQVLGSRPGQLSFERSYDRPSGKMKPTSLAVPAGRKIVLVEGVDATRFLNGLENGDTLKILLSVDPAKSIQQAVQRDIRTGRHSKNRVTSYREQEYQHMLGQIRKNISIADVVIEV